MNEIPCGRCGTTENVEFQGAVKSYEPKPGVKNKGQRVLAYLCGNCSFDLWVKAMREDVRDK